MSSESPIFGPIQHPLLIVISGPSGVGKDSLLRVLKEREQPFHFVVTVNTRSPRPDEQEGVDYIFISRDKFEEMKNNEELLEFAKVYDDYKGVPRKQVKEAIASGKDVLMRLDVQGANTIRKVAPEALLIFLTTSSEEELVERLRSRKTESESELETRIRMARQEFQRVDEFDFVVVNRDGELEAAVNSTIEIIRAEHLRVHPRKVSL